MSIVVPNVVHAYAHQLGMFSITPESMHYMKALMRVGYTADDILLMVLKVERGRPISFGSIPLLPSHL